MNAIRCIASILIGFILATSLTALELQAQSQTTSATVSTLSIQADSMAISVAYPTGWSVSPREFVNAEELLGDLGGRILITQDKASSHSAAVRMLRDIAAEEPAAGTLFLNVGGWPAIQRRFIAPVGRPSRGTLPEAEQELRITTAIAAGPVLVRLEARVPLTAAAEVADDAQAIGQALSFSLEADPSQVDADLNELQRPAAAAPASAPSGPESRAPAETKTSSTASPGLVLLSSSVSAQASVGLAQQIMTGQGELEIVASSDGRNIVVAKNFGAVSSQDGGQTFNPVPGSSPNDPSLAFAVSGNFYLASIGSAPGSNTTSIFRSTDNGQTFPFIAFSGQCPTSGVGSCFLDQEHIAADRVNTTASGDQVYSTWRNCVGGCIGVMISFSTDSAANWSGQIVVDAAGDFPRITVGPDGFVYVVYTTGGSRDGIRVRKYSSGASGLTFIAQADVVASPNSFVPCPVPGLDRCNDGCVLASPTIAVDDTNPQHIYVAHANTTGAGNDDVFVHDSLLGGTNWPAARVVRVNNPFPGRRYMPWVATMGGAARVTWYDRRAAASSIDNSMTDFYCGTAMLDGGGNLIAGPEVKLSPVSDSNCGAGWPCAPRSTNDSESCSIQPQFAGTCSNTNTKCDFSTPTNCAAMVACQTGSGCPKYGDYNGVATAAGRVFAAWTSATNPQGVQTGLAEYFASRIVCCVPQIQVPGSVMFPDTCIGTTNFATLLVCNTGKEDLEVSGIGSSNPRFAVTTPSSGYPVVISPDFCFPFQVRFSPSGQPGFNLSSLTITNNDTVNPQVTVPALGDETRPGIELVIANGGRFGNVCSNSFKDLDLTINNSGGCDLVITNITSSDPEFKTPQVFAFPLIVQGGTSIHVPIRLEPDSLGMKSASITVFYRGFISGFKAFAVSGNTPPGDVRVTGSTDFGDVCAGVLAEKQLAVCNVGTCNLNVFSVAFDPPCAHFTLINNPFPAAVSPDSCEDVTIRYTPTNCGPHSCTLKISTDDPDTPLITKQVTANTPCASIDVPPDQCFPPTVIQSVGACLSSKPFPVSNTGTCPLKITAVSFGGGNPAAYAFIGLPSFPIILEQGHVIGEGNFKIGFIPTLLARDTLATISVTYEDDPVSHHTTTVTRTLNGEGVRTGARVLVVNSAGAPIPLVEKLMIQRITGNRNKNLLNTVDNAMNLAPVTVTPAAPCGPFTYHREYSTVSNPIQLLPGSYQITATAVVNGKKRTKAIGFDVSTCTFNPNIVISLP